MNKNIFSILIVTLIFFTSCNNIGNKDTGKITSDNKTDTASLVKPGDSLLHTHATTGAKKLSCCIGPPSRLKIKADKK